MKERKISADTRPVPSEVVEFWKEYYSQNNCGTAYPIYFVIRDVNWQASYHFEDGDRFVCVYDMSEIAEADNLEELFKILKKDDYELKFPDDFDLENISECDVDSFCSLNDLCGIFAQKKHYKENNMFLLKSEAEQHLKSNHYHYSREAHVYCKHAWRAPVQEEMFHTLSLLTAQEGK